MAKDKRSKVNGGAGRKAKSRKKRHKILTARQSKFAEEFMKTKSRRQALIAAGYSTKNPDQSAYQVVSQIMAKGPDAMNALGLTLPMVIQKHLVPLLHAETTHLAQHEGEFTDHIDLEDNATRAKATDMAFRLLGAYPADDPVLNAKITVDMIVCDMPKTRYDVKPIDILPTEQPPRQLVTAGPEQAKAAPKKDPRPKD